MIRTGILLVVGFTLLACRPAVADEVVLKSGAVLTGEIESEDGDEVVLITDAGRMRLGRDLVAEIRRSPEKPAADEAGSGGEESREPIWSGEGIDPEVAPIAAGGRILVAVADGGVAAVEPGKGAVLWSVAEPTGPFAGFAGDGSGYYTLSKDGEVCRLSPREGVMLWRTPTGAKTDTPPILNRHGLFVLSREDGLFGLEPASGKLHGVLGLVAAPDTPLASLGDRLLVGTTAGRVIVIAGNGRRVLHEVKTAGGWKGAPLAISGKRLALAGNRILAVHSPGGAGMERHVVAAAVEPPLGATETRVFFRNDKGIVAVDLDTGRRIWRAELPGKATHLTPTDEAILVTTTTGRLQGLARSDGSRLWGADLGAPAASAPLSVRLGDGKVRVAVVTTKGTILAFEP